MIVNRVGLALAYSGRIAEAEIRRALAAEGLRPSHGHVLMVLAERKCLTQQALLEEMRVDPSVLVTILNDLEQDRLVSRRRDPADRRRHIVEISTNGTKLVARIDIAIQSVEAELFAGLAPKEVSTLHRLLDRIQANGEASCDE